jgi:amino-acid N-acetyltransferase
MNVHIERASEADGPSILHLLWDAGLPIDGLVEHLNTALIARDGDVIVGCAALLKVYPDGALLRSVVVAPAARGEGLGQQLMEAAIRLAQSLLTPAVYLLTTTAESYFPRFGFPDDKRAGPGERSAVHRIPFGVSRECGRDGKNAERRSRGEAPCVTYVKRQPRDGKRADYRGSVNYRCC